MSRNSDKNWCLSILTYLRRIKKSCRVSISEKKREEWSKEQSETCKKNHSGSASLMVVACMKRIYYCSTSIHKVRYVQLMMTTVKYLPPLNSLIHTLTTLQYQK